jgi:hypothetical protein
MTNKQASTRRPLTANPAHARSRVSNLRDILPSIDLRSIHARRYRDLVFELGSDAGGIERLAATRQQLIRRFAALSVRAEMIEAQLVSGAEIDDELLCQIASVQVRLATRLGLSRAKKHVPTLEEYLNSKAAGDQDDTDASTDDDDGDDSATIDMEPAST